MTPYEVRSIEAGWTDQVKSRVGALWVEGRSGSEIATIVNKEYGLKKTRNSIIGVIHRMGLSGTRRQATHPKTNTARAAVPRQPRRIPKPRLKLVGDTVFTEDEPRQPREELRARAWSPLEGFPPVRLEDREPNGCKWPINVGPPSDDPFRQFWCCGRTAVGNYCETHKVLGTQRPRTPAEKRADRERREKRLLKTGRAA